MNYWMNVLRGEWGFVENPKAAVEDEPEEETLMVDAPGITGRLVSSSDGTVAYLVNKAAFLVAFDYFEHHAQPLAFSPMSPF
jgi:hypothetical protein